MAPDRVPSVRASPETRAALDRPQAMFGLQAVLSTHFAHPRGPERYVQGIAAVARDGYTMVDRVLDRGAPSTGKTVKWTRKPKRADGGRKKAIRKKGRKRRR